MQRIGGGQQTDDVQICATEKCSIIEWCRGRNIVLLKIRVQYPIDRIISTADCWRKLRSSRAERRLILTNCEGESSFPGHSLVDPVAKRCDLLGSERRLVLRHPLLFVCGRDKL